MGKEFKDAVKTRPGYPGNYARKPDAAPIEGVYSGPKMAEAQKIRENEDELIAAVYAGPGMMGGDLCPEKQLLRRKRSLTRRLK